MTTALFLDDSYLKECEATVKSVDGNKLVLDKTIFYATSGGQPNDIGVLAKDSKSYKVTNVSKVGEEIIHEAEPGLKLGDKVTCKIDWERRYKLMRSHTAAHTLAAAINKETNALITGGELNVDKCKMDFDLENFNPEQIKNFIEKANAALVKNYDVKTYYLSREEFEKDPSLVKLAKGFPDYIKKVRIVAIGSYDIQADGGTHVKNTKEVGKIELIKCENKGKSRRRVYYAVR